MKKKHVVAGQDWEFDGKTITVHIPMTFKRRGGRKVIIAPDGGGAWPLAKPRPDETLIRAMAPAHRWKQMLENGTHRSISELAGAEKINRAYVCRLLNLTLLSPDLTEAVLEGRQPKGMMLEEVVQRLPMEWCVQWTDLN